MPGAPTGWLEWLVVSFDSFVRYAFVHGPVGGHIGCLTCWLDFSVASFIAIPRLFSAGFHGQVGVFFC